MKNYVWRNAHGLWLSTKKVGDKLDYCLGTEFQEAYVGKELPSLISCANVGPDNKWASFTAIEVEISSVGLGENNMFKELHEAQDALVQAIKPESKRRMLTVDDTWYVKLPGKEYTYCIRVTIIELGNRIVRFNTSPMVYKIADIDFVEKINAN